LELGRQRLKEGEHRWILAPIIVMAALVRFQTNSHYQTCNLTGVDGDPRLEDNLTGWLADSRSGLGYLCDPQNPAIMEASVFWLVMRITRHGRTNP
jgi:hypothetical protein